MAVMTVVNFAACTALGFVSLVGGVAGQIEAVDDVNLEKYVGRWTQVGSLNRTTCRQGFFSWAFIPRNFSPRLRRPGVTIGIAPP